MLYSYTRSMQWIDQAQTCWRTTKQLDNYSIHQHQQYQSHKTSHQYNLFDSNQFCIYSGVCTDSVRIHIFPTNEPNEVGCISHIFLQWKFSLTRTHYGWWASYRKESCSNSHQWVFHWSVSRCSRSIPWKLYFHISACFVLLCLPRAGSVNLVKYPETISPTLTN